jgi:hypothetical protein
VLFRSFRVRMEMISSISCMISARTGVAGSFQPALSSLASHGPFIVEGLSPLHYCLNPRTHFKLATMGSFFAARCTLQQAFVSLAFGTQTFFFFFLFRPGDGQEVNPLPAPLRR